MTNHNFESPKSVSQYLVLQNGEHLRVHSPRYFEAGRLYGQNWSQNLPKRKEIFEVLLERKILPVQSSYLWFSHSSLIFMQEAMKQREVYSWFNISTNHFGDSQLPWPTQGACQTS